MEQTSALSAAAPAGSGRRGAVIALGLIAFALAAWAAVVASSTAVAVDHLVPAALLSVWAGAGAVIAIRRPSETTGLVSLGGTIVGGVAVLATASLYALAHNASAPLGRDAALILRAIALALIPAAGLHLLLAMPAGALASKARRTGAVLGYVAAAGLGAVLASRRPALDAWMLVVWSSVAVGAGAFALAARYPKSNSAERREAKWIGWGATWSTGIAVAVVAIRALVSWPPYPGAVVLAATVVVPLALVLATFDRTASAIDRLLLNTISLAGLAAIVAMVYLAIVLGLGRVPTHSERTLLVLSMIAAGVATLIYIPARSRLQRFATRLVYGEREAPDEAIRTFGSRLSRAVPLDELLLQMAESLRKTLLLEAAEVWTGSGGRLELSVSDPERRGARPITLSQAEEPVVARAGVSGPAWVKVWLPGLLENHPNGHLRVAPATHSGQLLGLIVVRRSEDRNQFSAEEERTLTELARQVGLALHNVRLDSALQASLDELRRHAEELQASRARIVAAADAERRRIERNLHDGAQQYLVALAVKVGLTKQMMKTDTSQATEILNELSSDVQETLDELRRLAHGIYPPLLADRGLSEALRAAAERSPVPTSVSAANLERYSAEMEAAVYFCCLEALQNVGKYGGEGVRATIRVREEEGGLIFEVADDGAGFDVRARKAGAGFTNMNDRVGAIGGTLRVESAPGQGTTVSGAIPIRR